MYYVPPIILCIGLSFSLLSAQGDPEKLPSCVNTDAYDETTPVLSRNGDKLFFTRTADPGFEPSYINQEGAITSNKQDALYLGNLAMIYSQIAGKKITDPSASVYNQDIWFAKITPDSIGGVVHPGYPLNNALPNSLVSVSSLPDEYILVNQFYDDGSMYSGFSKATIDDQGRSKMPQPLYIYQFDLTSSDVDLTMTPDGHILVISMQRSDGKGLKDMYVSFYIRENVWSSPMHMGSVLNTSFQETSPHISPDKRFLYFSSNRPGGIGGSDIYVSERLNYSWLKWSEPKLLNGNVNTVSDESQPYFNADATYLYFTSRRDGTSDIFRQLQTPRPKLKKPLYVRGKIIDSETGLPVHSELLWGQHSADGFLEYFNTYTGEFEVSLTEYEPYKFQPRKANHYAQRILVDPRGMESQGIDTLDLILYLEPKPNREANITDAEKKHIRQNPVEKYDDAPRKETITFYDINFVKGKSIILVKSRGALKYVLDRMTDQPTMEILIEGHTDNVGDEAALIDLSLHRAEAIRDYLVFKGISADRIQVAGRGASRALFQNSTESGREKNRRVEITVIKS
ncbi:MAG: OmpA family protein [Saprospiraceae bacterium]|nr:OmpA family protein [Candidatus Opimibacter iunctus]